MDILNLTQHKASQEQIEAGVFDIEDCIQAQFKKYITFDHIPDKDEIQNRAIAVAAVAQSYNVDYAMIGGAPFFMSTLESALLDAGITPLYAFSRRIAEEKDGVKISVFKHEGFISAV